ncbi:DUF1566 domain-containing protein [Aliivibrio sifiae]|uniref:BIG2 domain-containing protein n=1 Tax=Aliivibrio sifiae TaxID=566293 RepID=A0A2S7X9V0_9GAMM|nr:DUF1566 domain-containing protein [Aliivibrio sifiae]PQJ87915.1 hypothetical protein BTO23_17705 [Aliivibrio sifiae]GLR73557.1 hypothetical protein GCM10007855_04300 [Aliivibrio sifiae]
MMKKHILCLWAFVSLMLVGCNNGDADLLGKPPTSVTEAKLYEINISPDSSEFYVPTQYVAIGKYDDGSEVDISTKVQWSTVTAGIVTIDETGLASPLSVGHTQITAFFNGITSDEASLNIISSMVCGHQVSQPIGKNIGGGIDDKDGFNVVTGACLKVREIIDPTDGNTKWFTSTPSLALMGDLGYSSDPTSDNSGDTYSSSAINESWEFGLVPGNNPASAFITFSMDGEGMYGQLGRWCKKLSVINFSGKSNWRIATSEELVSLYEYENPNRENKLFNEFGWPVRYPYWSSTFGTLQGSNVINVLSDPDANPFHLLPPDVSSDFYASCVSINTGH